jgi:hypothetical protein
MATDLRAKIAGLFHSTTDPDPVEGHNSREMRAGEVASGPTRTVKNAGNAGQVTEMDWLSFAGAGKQDRRRRHTRGRD